MAEMEKIVQILDVSGYDLLFTDLSHVQVSKIDNTPKKRKNVQVNVLPNVQAITSTDPQSEQLSDPNSVPGSTPKHLEKIVEVLSLSVRGLEAANAVLINELKDCREQNIQLKREIPSINRGMENPGTKSVG